MSKNYSEDVNEKKFKSMKQINKLTEEKLTPAQYARMMDYVVRRKNGEMLPDFVLNHPMTKDEWVKLFKKTFKFTGGEITGEFLISTGYLPGAHIETCPIYTRTLSKNPPWTR